DLVSTAQNGGGQDAHMQRVQLNEALARVSRLDQRLSFRVDESSGKSVVIVRDAHTSEVIKQYPSEEMLDVARRLEEYLQQSGDGAGLLHADDA
ncbi:MAG: flagellar protein FlaG, partial [Gammaproteobacteria bacterium]